MSLRSVIPAIACLLAFVLSSASEPISSANAGSVADAAVAVADMADFGQASAGDSLSGAVSDEPSDSPAGDFGQVSEVLCGCAPASSGQVRSHDRSGGSIPAFRVIHSPRTIPSVEVSAARILLSANRSGMRSLHRYIYSLCFLRL